MKRMKIPAKFILLSLIAIAAAGPVYASSPEPRLLQAYHDWDAFVFMDAKKQTTCFIATRPKDTEGKVPKRENAYIMVTSRPYAGSRDVVSYLAGYTIKPGTVTTMQVDEAKFDLRTDGKIGWSPNTDMDGRIFDALKSGKTLTVTGQTAAGVKVKDIFSLSGINDAYTRAKRDCD